MGSKVSQTMNQRFGFYIASEDGRCSGNLTRKTLPFAHLPSPSKSDGDLGWDSRAAVVVDDGDGQDGSGNDIGQDGSSGGGYKTRAIHLMVFELVWS